MTGIAQVLVGALIAGVFGLAGVVLSQRRERQHWLREARRSGYVAFLEVAERALIDAIAGNVGLVDREGLFLETAAALATARAAVTLLGPNEVAGPADTMTVALTSMIGGDQGPDYRQHNEALKAARDNFAQAARRALGVS